MFTVQPITIFDAEEFRKLRLETLRFYGKPFENFHAIESAQPIEYWENFCTERRDHCFFGLFYDGELIGTMGARQWEKDPSGKTAFWWGNYTKPLYRNVGATKDLYQLRIDWCAKQGYDRAKLYIMDGSTRPAEIIEKLGANKLHSEKIGFHGGEPILWHWYELDLTPRPLPHHAQPIRVMAAAG